MGAGPDDLCNPRYPSHPTDGLLKGGVYHILEAQELVECYRQSNEYRYKYLDLHTCKHEAEAAVLPQLSYFRRQLYSSQPRSSNVLLKGFYRRESKVTLLSKYNCMHLNQRVSPTYLHIRW